MKDLDSDTSDHSQHESSVVHSSTIGADASQTSSGNSLPNKQSANGVRAGSTGSKRILCILPGPAPLSEFNNEFHHLSEYLQGDVVMPVWKDDRPPASQQYGTFACHTTTSDHLPLFIKFFWNISFYVYQGISLHYRKQKFDAIVAYGPFTTAFAGLIVRLFTRTKLIVDFPGNPVQSYLTHSAKPSGMEKLKALLAKRIAPFMAKRADHLRLLFPQQLESLVMLAPERRTSFHYFTPIQGIQPGTNKDNTILVLGYPWFRKGVDIAIKAFLMIRDQFPDIRLKVVGFTHDRAYFEALAGDDDRIELLGPVSHEEAIQAIQNCAIFACPSRAEGMPRVLIEAMVAGKPIVASAVDGIPYYLTDNKEALIMPSNTPEMLAERLSLLLSDSELCKQLGQQARSLATQKLTEADYAIYFRDMVDITLGCKAASDCATVALWNRD